MILAHTAYRAYPVIGKIGKRRAGFDTVFRVAYRRVIYPVAYFTYIFVHSLKVFRYLLLKVGSVIDEDIDVILHG